MKKRILILTIAIVIIVATALVAMAPNNAVASAEALKQTVNEDNKYYEYTNSDTLLYSSDYTIRDYPSLIASRCAIAEERDQGAVVLKNSELDDPIVEIIPKELFFVEGDHLFVGQEYGFFVNTNKFNSGYKSAVLVFDIITDTDLVKNTDRVIVTVKPIFQYEYFGLVKEATSIDFYNSWMRYSLTENRVVPFPSYFVYIHNDVFTEYNMSESYYLKDISFSASLFNEQSLNRGDAGYNPYNDYGSYFTGFDYSYSGKHRVFGEFPLEDNGWHIADKVVFALGCFDWVPIVGKAINVLGKVYDAVSLRRNEIRINESIKNAEKGIIESTENKYTATCYYQNRDDQLKYYKDDNNMPYLVKTADLAVNTSSDDSIWYGVNDHVTGYFNIGHSALDGRQAEYTRFTNNIAVKVVDSDNDNVVATADTVTNNRLRNPNYKELNIDDTENVYMLPDGEDYFTFTAPYASDYDISINTNENVKVYIDNTLYQGTQLKITKYIAQNSKVNIKIFGNTHGVYCPIVISPRSNLSNITLRQTTDYLVKLGDISGVKKLSSGNNNVVIKNLYKYNGENLQQYKYDEVIKPDSEIDYPFQSGNTYYAVLSNNSTATQYSVGLTIGEVPTISINSLNTIKLLPNLTYYKVIVPEGGQYVQTISLGDNQLSYAEDDVFSYKVLDANLNMIVNGYSSVKGEYKASFDANKTYYFASTLGREEPNATIVLNKEKNAYAWQVDEGEPEYGEEIHLVRGVKYTLHFMINGQVCNTNIIVRDFSKEYNITINNGVLDIPLNSPIGGAGVTVFAKYYNADAFFDHILQIIPKFENIIANLRTYNKQDFGFMFIASKHVQGCKYELSIGNKLLLCKYTATSDNIRSYTNDLNTFIISIADCYNNLEYIGMDAITINITELTISTLDGEKSCECRDKDFSIVFSSYLFGGGTGTTSNPFTITCYRHLENIKNTVEDNCINYNFELTADITAPSNLYWTCLPAFYGTFDGKGHIISNLKIRSVGASTIGAVPDDSSTYYIGFIQKLYGTVKNVTFNNVSVYVEITKYLYCGIVTGYMMDSGKISNCKITQSGYTNTITVNNSSNTSEVGGIVGCNQGQKIEKCASICNISVSGSHGYFVGGLIGFNVYGEISQCYTEGTVVATSDSKEGISTYVGGLIGCSSSFFVAEIKIVNCYSDCAVKGVYAGDSNSAVVYAGGLIGRINRNYITYCYASGNVEARSKYAHAIAGGFAGQIMSCENGNLVHNVLSMGNVLAHGNYSGAETSYSRFGYLCGKENNNSFWNIYYNKDAQFKPGKTGTEVTWNTSWYIGKTASQIKTYSFFVNDLKLSTTYWNISSGSLPTLKI